MSEFDMNLLIEELQERNDNLNKENNELSLENQRLYNLLDKIKEIIKDNTNYLFEAEKIYVKCEDELLKSTVLQLINNDLVKNDKIFELLEEIE